MSANIIDHNNKITDFIKVLGEIGILWHTTQYN